MHTWAMASIDYIFQNKFRQAEEEARKIIRRYSDHPAGYFFMAAAIDSWMAHFQSDSREEDFYRYCDLAIEKAENMLSADRNNEVARFFKGGADGFKGTYEARYERWITAFRYGWRGVSELLELEKAGSDLIDIQFGIGAYEYWRSALMRLLWWMPGVQDKREEGIGKLIRVRENGFYTKTAASVTLIEVFVNEKRYAEALSISDEMLQKYPQSMAFLFGRAHSLKELKRYDEAVNAYKKILSIVTNQTPNNGYNETICRLALAQIYMEQENFSAAIEQCNLISNISFSNAIRRRLSDELSLVNNIQRQATRQLRAVASP
ncbi:hypothetical protein CHISP_0445 [Chitinispirillum alkaliphilum]|nr:hypothetical protein CHISP_0445 [Chitinispirillum alkaliphilum]